MESDTITGTPTLNLCITQALYIAITTSSAAIPRIRTPKCDALAVLAGLAAIAALPVAAGSATTLAIRVTADTTWFTLSKGGADAPQTEQATKGRANRLEGLAT